MGQCAAKGDVCFAIAMHRQWISVQTRALLLCAGRRVRTHRTKTDARIRTTKGLKYRLAFPAMAGKWLRG